MTPAKVLKVTTEGAEWGKIPPHVIGLTSGDRENPIFYLDTDLGVIHWPEYAGGGNYRDNDNGEEDFIETAWYEMDEDIPENEIMWRQEPAWAIEDFFELLKMQYRKLNWIPTDSRHVLPTRDLRDKDGMIAMLRESYREHG